ncbi:bifunctional DedA family/phosphatase PAP2 family protein [Halomonas urumqiensis]|uniref:PA-phosphatase n=1 Tax=Halomonas urumqiensis TaxID=1684789 RepID=A0A2N7UFI7_9GAMM|nr:bifunctional DedA family/phosphatase PAP2 family protein [Halomonas urumqiensis]PMR79206.1 PA-phosphatase [Halomonas urumqiensis]PTB03881.1 phosphatase PAP2 family protein [Halomonas urumqiensis]GHE19880.1 hypothetical protein GCM10017767_04010 [Halomonas urumqiensis]
MNLIEVLNQLSPSPGWLLAIIGLIALVESLALIGLLVPGVLLITATASLAGHQQLELPWVIAVAFVGAVAGDGVSYLLGYTQHERTTRLWPLSRHPEWLARAARFFKRYGMLSVLLGRFVGPVRPVIPLIAGMLKMPPRHFLFANVLSAALWAPAYILPGYLLGRGWQQVLDLPQEARNALILLAIIVIVLAVAFSWLRHEVTRPGRLYRLAANLSRRHPVMRRLWLSQRGTGEGEVPLASWLLLILSLGGWSGWTLMVPNGGPLPLDAQVHSLFAALATPWLVILGEWLARSGDMWGISALMMPWLGWLAWHRKFAAFTLLASALAGTALLNTLTKLAIGRPRPSTPEHLADSFSYPSAHTSTMVVVAGLGALFIARELPHRHRHLAYWGAIVAVVPMALSRLLIGVHWLSDLIGGALLGLVVCALAQLAWQARPRASIAPCPAGRLALLSALLVAMRVTLLPAV